MDPNRHYFKVSGGLETMTTALGLLPIHSFVGEVNPGSHTGLK
jgi:hypothetical protein